MDSLRSKQLSLFICAVLHGLNHALQLVLPPLYISIRDDFGLHGLSPVMLFGTIYFATYALMNLPYGFLGDHMSKKKILVFGAALNSIAFVLAASTTSYSLFMVAMILAGIGGGSYHPVATALISNLFRGMVGRAFGLIGMGASFGLFVGPFVSGYIGQQFGWRASCLLFAVFGCIVAAAFGLVMPDEDSVQSEKDVSVIPMRTVIIALLPVILVFCMREFCLWGAMYLTPAMTQMNFGFSKKAAGTLIGLMSLTGVISQPVAGTISDRIGRRRMLFLALIVGGVGVSLFPYFGGTALFLAALISGFVLLASVPIIDATAAEIVPPSFRGRMFGVLMTVGLMCGALSPYIMGLIYDRTGGYSMAYTILGIAALAGAAMVFLIPSKRPYS